MFQQSRNSIIMAIAWNTYPEVLYCCFLSYIIESIQMEHALKWCEGRVINFNVWLHQVWTNRRYISKTFQPHAKIQSKLLFIDIDFYRLTSPFILLLTKEINNINILRLMWGFFVCQTKNKECNFLSNKNMMRKDKMESRNDSSRVEFSLLATHSLILLKM